MLLQKKGWSKKRLVTKKTCVTKNLVPKIVVRKFFGKKMFYPEKCRWFCGWWWWVLESHLSVQLKPKGWFQKKEKKS